MKSSVVLVLDKRGWAFDNIADHVVANLGDEYAFRRVYAEDHSDIVAQMEAVFFGDPPDLVHFFWRELWFRFLMDFRRSGRLFLERGRKDTLARLGSPAVTSSIYDHLFSDDDELQDRELGLATLDGYSVASLRLERLYQQSPIPPAAVLRDGVDTSLFAPARAPRPEGSADLIVGWVGNSAWGRGVGGDDPKGLQTILRPALDLVRAQGTTVTLELADREVHWRPRSEMPEYYNGVDVLVCSSLIEGTPNPVLEAMACGVPVVSTDVGVVSEVFGPVATANAVVDRTPEAMAHALLRLANDSVLRKELADENLARVQSWTWESRMPAWRSFFDSALAPESFTRRLILEQRLVRNAERLETVEQTRRMKGSGASSVQLQKEIARKRELRELLLESRARLDEAREQLDQRSRETGDLAADLERTVEERDRLRQELDALNPQSSADRRGRGRRLFR